MLGRVLQSYVVVHDSQGRSLKLDTDTLSNAKPVTELLSYFWFLIRLASLYWDFPYLYRLVHRFFVSTKHGQAFVWSHTHEA